MPKLLLLCLIAAFSNLLTAQQSPNLFDFIQKNEVPVTANGKNLSQAWAGGINYAQINPIDLDLDGTKDLMVFDRSSGRVLTFLTVVDDNNISSYSYAPQYEAAFPSGVEYILCRDYNCDGKMDLFFGQNSNVRVRENTSTTELSFTDPLNGDYLKTNYGGGYTPIYISSVDKPAIIDLDDDGDLDILTFTNSGSVVEWHENQNSCGLNFVEEETCWGHFSESGLYRAVSLNSCNPYKKKTMHSGSSILILNLDGDQDKDLLLGNVSYPDLTALYNTGSNDSVHFTSQDTLFPTYTQSLVLTEFPAAYYEDVTFDGIPDLIASPYVDNDGAEDKESVILYTNNGTRDNPVFQPTTRSFLQSDMIDLGRGAVPRFYDFNGDSLQDLVVANRSEFVSIGQGRHYYHYYQNIGSKTAPAFQLVDTNFAQISNYFNAASIPTFGDINNDGQIDMIVGDKDGQVHYFTGNSLSFNLQTPGLLGIDVGREAAPYLFDMDEDGDLDLLIGNDQGKIAYYENSSINSPAFQLVNDYYGGIDVYSRNAFSGASIPYVFRNAAGTNLVVGSAGNGIYQYDSLDYVNSKPKFLEGIMGTDSVVSSGFEMTPFGTSKRSGRNQILIRASELEAAGLDYGNFTELSFQIASSNNSTIWKLKVSMKLTTDTVLTDFHNDLTRVRSENPISFDQGWARINLEDEFGWDGKSNLIIEVCFRAQSPSYNVDVLMSDAGFDGHAIGDINGYNTLAAKGCEQPFKRASTMRPNIRLRMTPAAANTASYFGGIRTAPAVADLNNDGYPEFVVGNLSGGLSYYEGVQYFVSEEEHDLPLSSLDLSIYPNPGSGLFEISAPIGGELDIYDLRGQHLMSTEITEANSQINLESFPPGVYLFRLSEGQDQITRRVVKY